MANVDEYDFTQESKSGQPGFETFKSDIDGMFYFHFNDSDGKAVLFSESYPTESARDNGVESVKKNAPLEERWKIVEEGGKYFYSLKAGNHQEIARGFPFDTMDQLNASLAYLQGKTTSFSYAKLFAPAAVVAAETSKSEREIDDYMVCSAYKGHTDSPAEGFRTFYNENNKEYYFAMVNKDGDVLLRSEGYPTVGARDNGLRSVQNNMDNPDRWSTIEEGGLHYRILKAGNHQEIGRSCPHKDKGSLLTAFAGIGGIAALVAAIPAVAAPVIETPAYVAPKIETPAYVAPELDVEEPSGGLPKWLWWLLGALLLGALLWWLLKGCDKPKVDLPAADTTVVVDTTKPVVASTSFSEDFAPATIYFDNDRPKGGNPSYGTTYDAYVANKGKFEAEGDKAAVDAFFTNDVKKGYDDLQSLATKLAEKLKDGAKGAITLKAFASPLATPEYNKGLTARRIASIKAHLSAANNGALKEAINNGTLTIAEESNGEDSSPSGISDDGRNRKSSVYDIAASKERRVEIVGVKVSKE